MTLYASDANARAMILKVSGWLNRRGYLAANDGNISCKSSANEFWTVATGVYKGYLEEDMLIKMDTDGNIVESYGPYLPSADVGMHLRVYREYPMCFGVLNAQPPYATLCSIRAKPLTDALLPATVAHLGIVPVAPYAKPGSDALAETISAQCKGYNALLLENRGLLVWGANLFEAYQRFETAEQYAQMTYLLDAQKQSNHLLGKDDVDALLELRERFFLPTGGVPRSREDTAAQA